MNKSKLPPEDRVVKRSGVPANHVARVYGAIDQIWRIEECYDKLGLFYETVLGQRHYLELVLGESEDQPFDKEKLDILSRYKDKIEEVSAVLEEWLRTG